VRTRFRASRLAALRVLLACAVLVSVRLPVAAQPAPAPPAPKVTTAAPSPTAAPAAAPTAGPEQALPTTPVAAPAEAAPSAPDTSAPAQTAPAPTEPATEPSPAAAAPQEAPSPPPAPVAAAPSPAPAPSPATPPQAEVPATRPTPTVAERSWVGAGVALGVLNLPKLGAGAKVMGQLRSNGLWPVDLAAVYWFDNEAPLTRDELDLQANPLISVPFPPAGSRLHVTAVQVSAAVCPYERALAPGSLLLCAGVQGGVVRVRSEGFIAAERRSRPQFGFEGYARWHFDLGEALGVTYSAGIFVPLMRDAFGYTDHFGKFSRKFRAAPVGGRLDLALTYAF
jgi:hypothetical protein